MSARPPDVSSTTNRSDSRRLATNRRYFSSGLRAAGTGLVRKSRRPSSGKPTAARGHRLNLTWRWCTSFCPLDLVGSPLRFRDPISLPLPPHDERGPHQRVLAVFSSSPPLGQDEPRVSFHWSTRDPVRPTWLSSIPTLARRRLLARWVLTGLQHVVDLAWMRWAGVTHVINCIGPMRGSEPNPTFSESVENRIGGVRYMTWTASNAACRRDYRRVLSTIHYLLGDPRVCLHIRCIHARDRSVCLVALYCVAILGMTIRDTTRLVLVFHGSSGEPPMKLQRLRKNDQFTWLQSIESRTSVRGLSITYRPCQAFVRTSWVNSFVAARTWMSSTRPRSVGGIVILAGVAWATTVTH